MSDSDPRQCSVPLISLLAECEPWIIPHDCETHPLVLSFYVPAHLAAEARRMFTAVPTPRTPRPSVRGGLHVVKGGAS